MQLTNITTSNQPAAATLTQLRYEELVAQRKACRACASCGLINPSVHLKGAYDADEIGPFTRWCGDLDAELMVIGQDWLRRLREMTHVCYPDVTHLIIR